jgi:hypothetical protein
LAFRRWLDLDGVAWVAMTHALIAVKARLARVAAGGMHPEISMVGYR